MFHPIDRGYSINPWDVDQKLTLRGGAQPAARISAVFSKRYAPATSEASAAAGGSWKVRDGPPGWIRPKPRPAMAWMGMK